MLEDRIYELQDEVRLARDDLAKCRRESQAARKVGPVSTQVEAPAEPARSSRAKGPELVPPRSSRPAEEYEDGLPRIIVETPKEPLPPGKIPQTLQSTPESESPSKSRPSPKRNAPAGSSTDGKTSRSRSRTPAAQDVVPASATVVVPASDSARVDRVAINRLLVGGWDMDGRPGDEGIFLLVEPKDAEGRTVLAAAPVSVVLLDRGFSGDAARVARWDLTAEQAAARFRRVAAGEGLYLELPWRGSPPVHGHLQLFVRYTTRDGRKLEVSREVDVSLENQGAEAAAAARKDEPTAVRLPAEAWQAKHP